MITHYEPIGRAVFARYDNGEGKLVCVCEFADDETGYGYDEALNNAEHIAELLNKSII